MSLMRDLTGRIFSALKVLSKEQNRKMGDQPRTMWACICTCGEKKTISATNLIQGHTKSCGCRRKRHQKYFGNTKLERGTQCRLAHRDEINRRKRERYKKILKQKLQQDPKFRINATIGTMMRQSIKENKRGKSWEALVGYSVQSLMVHLQEKFKEGMSWENYGDWHIDHKIPISAFNFNSPQNPDFERCWVLSNLQPMWEKENLIKGKRLEIPFQPMLNLSVTPAKGIIKNLDERK